MSETILTMGTVVDGRYRLISEGNPRDIGVAYQAHDLQRDRVLNLVVVDAHWGNGQEALGRLQRVQQAITGLSAPGLIPYEHTGLAGGQVYLVYPRARGQTLADLLAQKTRLDPQTAVTITIRLCEALAPVHRSGLTHGSLSPHCVMLRGTKALDDPAGADISVFDTGLLPALRPADAPKRGPWGRLPYISPEQASGQGVQPPSDVYIVGALLYEMLIGHTLFRAADEVMLASQHLHNRPPSLQIMDINIPQPLAQIVYRTLAKEPSARYRNASQLAHILWSQVGPQPEPIRPTHREHLVVPPPPAPTAVWTRTFALPDTLKATGEQSGARKSVDWVLIALLAAALIAVLGLIPLWQAVYSHYAGTPASSYSIPHPLEAEPVPLLSGERHQGSRPFGGAELGEPIVVWYNVVPSGFSVARLYATDMPAKDLSVRGRRAPSFGVQLTGQGEKV